MSMSVEPQPRQRSAAPDGLQWRARTPATVVRLVVVPLGFAAGIAAAIYSHSLYPDGWLAFFVFAMVVYTFGWGLAQVLTHPKHVQRALYFALEPILSAGVLYASFQLGAPMWLAVILGFVAGGMLHTVFTWVLVPRVAAEEGGAIPWYQRSAPQDEAWSRERVHGFFQHPVRSIAVGIKLDQFYTAIKARDYATAYSYLGTEAQAAINREEFITRAEARDVLEGAVREFAEVGMDHDDPESVTLAVARPGSVYITHLRMRREAGTWRIARFDAL